MNLPDLIKYFEGWDTNTVEALLDTAYEAGAPQKFLERMETIYAGRINEEEAGITEDELKMTEAELYPEDGIDMGYGPEEYLSQMYYKYINTGARRKRDVQDIIDQMRDVIELMYGKSTQNFDDTTILETARHIYNYRQSLCHITSIPILHRIPA